MSGDLTRWLGLITSEHKDKPRFVAALSALLQPLADNLDALKSIPPGFDLDSAVGAQLDVVGLWVGRSRFLALPLVGVYFSFDLGGVGFDQGAWKGPFDPVSGLVALPDDSYRTLLRFQVLANRWDGTIPGAYACYSVLFSGPSSINWFGFGPVSWSGSGPVFWIGFGFGLLIQDNGDMTMLLALQGNVPDLITEALLLTGQLELRPAGVRIAGYVFETVAGAPFFGFDADTASVAGFDDAAWGDIQAAA